MELLESQIKEYALDEQIYEAGKNFYQAGAVVSLEVDEHSNPKIIMIHGTVLDGKQYADVNIAIDKDDYQIQNHLCDCPERFSCPHVIAVLCKLYEQLSTQVKRDVEVIEYPTDEDAKTLIAQYEREELDHTFAVNAQSQIHLEPVIELYQDTVLLTLKVGVDKMYIVKDINVFLLNMNDHVQRTYGKDLTFFHHEAILDGPSKVLFQFLKKHQNDQYYFQSNPNFHVPYAARCLPLTKAALDEFFMMFLDQDLWYRFEDKHLTNLVVKEYQPSFSLCVEAHHAQYHIQLDRYDYQFIEGMDYGYFIMDRHLYRCPTRYYQACAPLLISMQRKQKALHVHESDMASFYYHIIMPIKDYIAVRGDDITQFAPQSLQAKLYLDMPQAQSVSARLVYHYGNIEFPAFSLSRTNNARNYHEEMQIRLLLTRFMTRVDAQQEMAYIENSQDALYDFFQKGLPLLSQVCEIYATDKIRKVQIKNSVSVSLGVHMHGDLLELDLQTYDFPPEELQNVLNAYHLHKKYYRMKNGSFVNIEDNALHELSQLLDGMHLDSQAFQDGSIRIPKYRSLAFDNLVKDHALLKIERDHAFKEMIKGIRNSQDNDYEVPKHLKPILRNYQKAGYRWLKTMSSYGFGGILADDMGIGKTLQVITLLEDELDHHPDSVSLVVCPSSVLLNWQSEIAKFSSTLNCLVVHGTAQERKRQLAKVLDYDVVVTSYDYLKRDIDLYENYTFTYHIIDEAQFIKNHITKNAQTVKQIHSLHKFALTGTPIENSLAELWSIFDFLMPGYLYPYAYFKKMYELPIIKNQDHAILKKLQKLVEPFILRRVKKDVLKELPEKVETTVMVDLPDEVRKLYMANVAIAKQELKDGQLSNQNQKFMVLAMLTKLRQLCCDPRLLYSDYDHGSAKLDACMEIVENCIQSQKKVLIFSQFTSLLALIEEKLADQAIPYYLLKGSTPKNQRQQMVNTFHTNDIPVFLISLKAGGTGINLTSAEVVIHFDPWWNVSAQNQATDRAYRIGQHNNVQVFQLIAKDTIEEKIMELQSQKQQLSDSIIQENQGTITQMSTEDLLNLI